MHRTVVDNAPLVVFRVLFGALMLAECWGALATGWVRETFVAPRFTFPLIGFEWLRVLSGPVMVAYFAVMGAAALGVLLGWRYRASALLLAALWTGAYLAQKSHYNNHYYLAVLVTWGMAAVPANRRASLDVRRGAIARETGVDRLVQRSFRAMLAIVFTYAALAKLYPGWLGGDYLRLNLGSKGDRWPLGALVVQPWFQSFTVVAAIVFDALVVPALCWRRTRVLAFVGLVAFDLFNSVVFHIGVFPYLVLAWTVFFFEPASVARVFRWIPGLVAPSDSAGPPESRTRVPAAARGLVAVFFAVQLALPLRHHLFRGDVAWTEEGHRMSWRMMLRTKSGELAMTAVERSTGEAFVVDLGDYLTPHQIRRAAVAPEFCLQVARVVAEDLAASGRGDFAIHARSNRVSLNGAPPAQLVDPDVDLARARWRPFGRDPWVLDRPREP